MATPVIAPPLYRDQIIKQQQEARLKELEQHKPLSLVHARCMVKIMQYYKTH